MFRKLRSLFGGVPAAPLAPPVEGSVDGADYSIDAALRDHFAPVLRRHGFTGSGRHFRRVTDGVFQAVNVQGSMSGGQFAVNLGVHPLALPKFDGEPIDVKKTKEIDCEFRRRLSETPGDQWWRYSDTRASVTQAAGAAAQTFEAHGLPALNGLAAAEGPLFNMTPEQFNLDASHRLYGFRHSPVRTARALSILRKASGDLSTSKAFAEIALENLGGAVGLRAELSALAL